MKSSKDVRPKYGDICRHTAFHVGVSLGFDGDIWNHADAGQGGPKVGHDVIKRTRGPNPYDYTKLQGWIDLELYFEPDGQAVPVPEWLVGWWKVTWRGQTYYYYFERNRQVKWTWLPPLDASQPPLNPEDTGTVAIGFPNAVTTRWGKTGAVEKLGPPLGNANEQLKPTTMQGTWNSTEPLTAAKM